MWLRISTIAGLLGLLAGCGQANGSTGTEPGTEPGGRQAEVYAAVLRHHLGKADGDWSTIYVLDRTIKDVADGIAHKRKGTPIPAEERRGITARLKDMAPVTFVSDRASLTTGENDCRLKDADGVLVTFAPISGSGDKLTVGIEAWRACTVGEWLTYVVERDSEAWKVTGTDGPISIS